MKEWSDPVIHNNFKVTFYLDTNILSFLVDKTFSGLNNCFEFLSATQFVALKSSRYVIFEYISIRKREHYLRKILELNTNPESGTVNLSSLLLYKEGLRSKGVDFKSAMVEISKKIIEVELDIIVNQFKIDYEESEIHSELWRPTFDLLLVSRISREDSLVTLSSAFPLPLKKEDDIHILTNDERFVKDYMDNDLSEEIDGVFTKYDIKKPQLMHISDISCNGSNVNLTRKEDDPRSLTTLKDKVIDCILAKNSTNLIGKTIPVPKKAPTNVICFELPANAILKDNQFLVFVGKDLDFIYTTRIKVTGYLDNMQPLTYPYSSNGNKKLSFSLFDIAEDGKQLDVSEEIINKIRESGNMLFMHPDADV
jgi:hypothetical protein